MIQLFLPDLGDFQDWEPFLLDWEKNWRWHRSGLEMASFWIDFLFHFPLPFLCPPFAGVDFQLAWRVVCNNVQLGLLLMFVLLGLSAVRQAHTWGFAILLNATRERGNLVTHWHATFHGFITNNFRDSGIHTLVNQINEQTFRLVLKHMGL